LLDEGFAVRDPEEQVGDDGRIDAAYDAGLDIARASETVSFMIRLSYLALNKPPIAGKFWG